tara:strand:- start:826 stop:1557 length:732 start_codon:yes stop_codon:yes gene_type:complete
MQISKGIHAIGPSLFIEREEILVINDLHIGYEEVLHRKGILVPKFQLNEINKVVDKIFEQVKPKKIIINGDLKHEFGRVLRQEWKEVLAFLDFLLEKGSVQEVIIIQGNHDPIIKPIAKKRNVKVVKEFRIEDIHIVHGDEIVETDANIIIIGHEHTAIIIKEGSKFEKFKCFLKGKWKNQSKGKKKVHELIVVPSFNPLIEGTDVLSGNLLSPFLKEINNFEVFVVGEEKVYEFGKLKNLAR